MPWRRRRREGQSDDVGLAEHPCLLVLRPTRVQPSAPLDTQAPKLWLRAGKAALKRPSTPSRPALASPGMATEFRILGPLEVIEDGTVSPARRARSMRALLAVLLAPRDAVVSTDRLIDALCETPRSARSTRRCRCTSPTSASSSGKERCSRMRPATCCRSHPERSTSRTSSADHDGQPRMRSRSGAARHSPTSPTADSLSRHRSSRGVATCQRSKLCIDADLAVGRYTQLILELDALICPAPTARALARQLDARPLPRPLPGDALEAYQRCAPPRSSTSSSSSSGASCDSSSARSCSMTPHSNVRLARTCPAYADCRCLRRSRGRAPLSS